jgi:hypothetical protein
MIGHGGTGQRTRLGYLRTFRKGIGGYWRSSQQQVTDQFDRLLER